MHFGLDVTVGAVQMIEVQRECRGEAEQLEVALQALKR